MLKTPELSMPRTNKVTTVCNGNREVWTDSEEAKAYFLELMMTTEGRSMNVRSAFTFNCFTGWMSVVMRTNNQRKGFAAMQSLLLCHQMYGNIV